MSHSPTYLCNETTLFFLQTQGYASCIYRKLKTDLALFLFEEALEDMAWIQCSCIGSDTNTCHVSALYQSSVEEH